MKCAYGFQRWLINRFSLGAPTGSNARGVEAHAAGASHFAFGWLVCSKRFPTLPAVASEPPRPCFATDEGDALRQASHPPSPLLRACRSRYARGQRYLLGATPPAAVFVGYRTPVRAIPMRVFSLYGGSALPCHLDLIRFLSIPHCRAVRYICWLPASPPSP